MPLEHLVSCWDGWINLTNFKPTWKLWDKMLGSISLWRDCKWGEKKNKKGVKDRAERKMSIKINIPVIECSTCECEYDNYYYFLSFGGVLLFLIQKKVFHLTRKKSHKPPAKTSKRLKMYKERNFANSIYKNEVKIQKYSYSLGFDYCSIETVCTLRHACA